VDADQDPVPGQPDVALQPVRAVVESPLVCSKGVFSFDRGRATMRNHVWPRSHR
jgi:hypothetical protein